MLKEYKRKRNFAATPEPLASPEPEKGAPLMFVIQKHDATRLHYDLRLECDGALKSWAVPKGPSLDTHDRRLAVMVEDHPLSYASFEGKIPKGNYGAGEVIVWDRGTYEPAEVGPKSRDEAEKIVRDGIRDGKLKVAFHGQKMQGEWVLVRKDGDPKTWFLIKHGDSTASPDTDLTTRSESVLTGSRLTVDGASAAPGAKQAPMPSNLTVMAPVEMEKPFSDPKWSFELKLDGVRVLAYLEHKKVKLISRNLKDITHKFPSIVRELAQLDHESAALDGEIVLFDEEGRPSFQGLMDRYHLADEAEIRRKEGNSHVDLCLFDVLYLDGWSLLDVPFKERRALLEKFPLPTRSLRTLDVFPEEGELLFEHAQKLGFEGIVGKRLESRYRPGTRSNDWVKAKGYHSEEFLICGYTRGEGARGKTFGALLLGRSENGALRYCGNCGGGFGDSRLDEMKVLLDKFKAEKSPFSERVPSKSVQWLEPKLWAEVRFMSWTRDRHLRFPVFQRLRPDLENAPAVPQVSIAGASNPEAESILERLSGNEKQLSITIQGHEIKFTSLEKELWPGLSKRDYLSYLARICDTILPHLRDRPLSLVRCPDGIDGHHIFQKHYDKNLPAFVETATIFTETDNVPKRFLLCNNLPTLLWFGQMAVLEIHPWYSRVVATPDAEGASVDFSNSAEDLENSVLSRPDFLVCDLDPNIGGKQKQWEKTAWTKTVEVGLALHELLGSSGLRSYPKSTGKSGLHVFIPLFRNYEYHEVHAMAKTIGEHLQRLHPQDVTVEFAVKKRPQAVLFDYNQNVRGKTLAAAYSARAVPGAPVSFPLLWDELKDYCPPDVTIQTAPDFLANRPDSWGDILLNRQSL